jgi:DsbC/DsbD-like thiol-disulfide interchange protein/cytochrome c biogenesis protein CcdA
MRLQKFLVGALLLLLLGGLCRGQMYQGTELVKASLLADVNGIVPGQPVTIGLELQTAPGWHTYWEYAGDAGVPTRADWKLPAGFTAGPIQWPIPARDQEPGDIVDYIYPGDVLLPVEIQTPADLKPGQTVTINAHASWLVCKDLCVPGKADVSITLPVVAANQPANADLFTETRAELPLKGRAPFAAAWSRQGQALVLKLVGLDPQATFDFFPLPGDVQIGHPQVTPASVSIPLVDPKATPDAIDGVVVLKGKDGTSQIWQLPSSKPSASIAPAGSGVASGGQSSLFYWLGLGFVGGLILNVMPCVLPVIALKIFGFIKQAGESPRRILALGFTFVAGIFAWFLLLAGLLVSFKLAGHQLNWAFQFQRPAFVAVMVVVLLLFALNLLGVFEIVLPQRIQAKVFDAAGGEGYAGTFWHGVFATLMATPCTAPFLGSALGFALAAPAPTVFAMFGSIAAGMSAPYAVLAVKPGWLRFLPKPGIWMVRVKQGLGVLMIGTVAWLGWVLVRELTPRPVTFPQELASALTKHKIIFVDFTADWCVNCKVNESQVLDSGPVRDAFKQHGVILLTADWTRGDEAITAYLRKYGRAGVPCYVVFSPDGRPTVLPEVITRDIVLNALSQAESS